MRTFIKYYLFGLTILLATFYCPNISAQNQVGKFGLEITKTKLGLHAGAFRGKNPHPTDGTFNKGASFLGQAYFPFQLAADYRNNFTDTSGIKNEYNNRVFLIRSSAIFHVVDNGSMAFGMGIQLSFLITNEFYLEYQISGVYVEANDAGAPDLIDGFNLHHLVSLSKPISRHYSLTAGFNHISSAGIGDVRNSNIDTYMIGIKWNL